MEYADKVKNILKKKKKLLVIVFVAGTLCIMIGLIYDILLPGDLLIERNPPGGGNDTQEIVLFGDGERRIEEVEIKEKIYTREELDQAFQDGFAYLKGRLLEHNESLSEIRNNVEIDWNIPDTPLSVTWEFEDESVLDMEGIVYNSDWKNETKTIHLLATISYEDEEKQEKRSRVFTLKICPRERTKAEEKLYQVWKKISVLEEKSRKEKIIHIPARISGIAISKKGRKNPVVLFGGMLIMVGILIVFRDLEAEKQEIDQRQKASKLLYPEILWQFVILIEAGHTIPMAWNKIVQDYQERKKELPLEKQFVFEQMTYGKRQMELGVPYEKVFIEFGETMKLKCYSKLMLLFSQNMSKGSKNMLQILKEEEQQAFFERCEEAKRQGEEADTKLLLPMGIMLLNILLLLMIPAYMQFI